MTKILILGGTAEARALAGVLVARGHEVTTSLAGRTRNPILPAGRVRIGGFGGAEGLARHIGADGVERLVDATHPYAARMSANAVAAAGTVGIALVRLNRRAWTAPEGARWSAFPDAESAAAGLPAGAHVLLTTGHHGLEHFRARADCRLWARVIEPPAPGLPDHLRLVRARPPHGLADELALMRAHAITHLVSKNSGGPRPAKLEAARVLGVAVAMIARPALPPAAEAEDVDGVLEALALDA